MPASGAVDMLEHPKARVAVRELGTGRREVRVTPSAPMGADPAGLCCETGYPVDLIAAVLDVKGPHHLCDELRRHEDPRYVELYFRWATLSFVAEEHFRGKRLLDFG